MTRHWSQFALCAREAVTLAVRSRWLQIFAVVFAAIALLIASAGYILSGGSGVQDFARTGASLLQLVVLLVPLAALVFGVLELTPDRGAAELLYSQPVSRGALLAGRLAGLFVALVAAQWLGFGAAGLVVFSQAGAEGLGGFVAVVGGAMVLTAVFLSVAASLAAGHSGRRRARVLALALVTWFAVVVLFDIAALGVASLLPSGRASRVLIGAAVVNPVDAVRTGCLLLGEGTAAFGGASLAFLRVLGGAAGAGAALAISLAAWMLVPLIVAVRRLARADI